MAARTPLRCPWLLSIILFQSTAAMHAGGHAPPPRRTPWLGRTNRHGDAACTVGGGGSLTGSRPRPGDDRFPRGRQRVLLGLLHGGGTTLSDCHARPRHRDRGGVVE